MAGIVVVFDFDHTIIDCDSDDWVFDQFGVTKLFNQLLSTMSWNSSVDMVMKEIHSLGGTIEEMVEGLKRVPLHPQMITAIKSAHSLGCDLRIVSDANVFFIETILKHYGLLEYFSEIITNPNSVDEQGRFRVLSYNDFAFPDPHECSLACPPNLCKGKIIERMRDSLAFDEGKKQIIYIGDGKGDFCPSLKMREGDYLMPRKNYPVWELICNSSIHIKAEIHEWSSGDDFEGKLLDLINKISVISGNEEMANHTAAKSVLQSPIVTCNHQVVPLYPQAQPC
ncbi:hypothetical protein MKX03_003331 [Papaver bracteatum]|nr:hypothetical protein MKX03_003331 [Papaver bracteatum]